MDNKLTHKKNTKIINSKDLLMISLSTFYNDKHNISKIIPIISPTGNNRISLRLIDWFVTNYSKKNNTIIKTNTIAHFNVYLSYRSQLKAYSKQLFDSFRRRDRITFFYDVDKSIETTIGQLNMFRWILQNDILDYIQSHLELIENDMIKTQKDNQNKRDEKIKAIHTENGIVYQKRKKRNQLSKSSTKNMNLFAGQRIIKFD
jgi:hypothetical protein